MCIFKHKWYNAEIEITLPVKLYGVNKVYMTWDLHFCLKCGKVKMFMKKGA